MLLSLLPFFSASQFVFKKKRVLTIGLVGLGGGKVGGVCSVRAMNLEVSQASLESLVPLGEAGVTWLLEKALTQKARDQPKEREDLERNHENTRM